MMVTAAPAAVSAAAMARPMPRPPPVTSACRPCREAIFASCAANTLSLNFPVFKTSAEACMNVHVIGGGPAGLYFAILMKKAWPQTRITVFERNKPDDTFGFGVVFSDQTLDTFETYDRESYRAIVGHFAYWADIEIHFRGTTHRIGGNGFCGCSRATLLKILGRRARALGVEIRYQSEISPLDPITHDDDLVVVADGINSRMSETFADTFKPSRGLG